jgi:hypothetical protein
MIERLMREGLRAELSATALKVLLVLGLDARPGAEGPACWVPHAELAQRAGMARNTLTRCTAELEGKGLIARRRAGPGERRCGSVYLLLPPTALGGRAAGRPAESSPEARTGADSEPERLAAGVPAAPIRCAQPVGICRTGPVLSTGHLQACPFRTVAGARGFDVRGLAKGEHLNFSANARTSSGVRRQPRTRSGVRIPPLAEAFPCSMAPPKGVWLLYCE